MSLNYHRHIDGLRAVAVLPVLLFHSGSEMFSGGYAGVDVFFVISGYLITAILVEEIENNRFSLITFYERRARRILPALFFVISLSSLVAYGVMRPAEFIQYGRSLIAVSIFLSNILFWREAGYFETSSEEKPLLHTWSLSVEEQYYLLFPVLLLTAYRVMRRRGVGGTLLVVAFVSFALAQFASSHYPVPNFYLGPTRAWELLAGSICALVGEKPAARCGAYFSTIGILAIGISIFVYDEFTPFPSVFALLPVIGTCLVIVYGSGNIVGRFLSVKILVWPGLLSYSIYLWHQPVLAFFRMSTQHIPLHLPLYLAVVGFLAFLTWRFIEQPFRDRTRVSQRSIFIFSGLGILGFLTLGTIAIKTGGFVHRIPIEDLKFIEPLHSEYSCEAVPSGNLKGVASCYFGADAGSRIAVLGDSHADALAIGLDSIFKQEGYQATRYSLPQCHPILGMYDSRQKMPDLCDRLADELPSYLADNYDQIVLHLRWTFRFYPVDGAIMSLNFNNMEGGIERQNAERVNYPGRLADGFNGDAKLEALQDYIANLSAAGRSVTIIGPVPEPGWHVGQVNMKHYLRGEEFPDLSTSYALFLERNRFILDALSEVEKMPSVNIVYPHLALCSELSGRCAVQTDQAPYYWDDDHLSLEGVNVVLPAIARALTD